MRAGARAGQAIRDAVGSREEMRRVVEEVLNLRSRYAMAGAVVVVLTLGGVVYVSAGLGGMSGAQPQAATNAGCIGVIAEVNRTALMKRHAQVPCPGLGEF